MENREIHRASRTSSERPLKKEFPSQEDPKKEAKLRKSIGNLHKPIVRDNLGVVGDFFRKPHIEPLNSDTVYFLVQ